MEKAKYVDTVRERELHFREIKRKFINQLDINTSDSANKGITLISLVITKLVPTA